MKDLSVHYEIARRIAAEIAETITPEEKVKLEAWLKEDEGHIVTYSRIRQRLEEGGEDISFRELKSVRKDLKKVQRQLFLSAKRPLIRYSFIQYAAVAVLLIGSVVWIWQKELNEKTTGIAIVEQQANVFLDSSQAVLTLANGEQIGLEEMKDDSMQKDGMLIRKNRGELSYEQLVGNRKQGNILFNMITIPRSGEYRLTLADGTRVWLNSASELKYPVEFSGDSRKVFLKGEAYFEVVSNPDCPFVVETAEVSVNVLGTGFNVMAYPDESDAVVTLVHGKVGVRTGKEQVILQPEEQYVYQLATCRGDVRKVDVSYYTAWKEGILNFDAMSLEELSVKLSRWYDVDFFFASEELKHLKFSGAFKKYNTIQYVLNVIEEITDVKFDLNNRTVTVIRK